MPEPITEEELKEAIELWAPKFNLIRELWPGASIEESLKLMAVIEEKAGEIKENKKKTMGFGFAENKSKSTGGRSASSTYNDWTNTEPPLTEYEFLHPNEEKKQENSKKA